MVPGVKTKGSEVGSLGNSQFCSVSVSCLHVYDTERKNMEAIYHTSIHILGIYLVHNNPQ